MASPLAERIRKATQAGLERRDQYDAQTAAGLTEGLMDAQDQVAKAILKYKTLGSLPDNKLAALTGLEKLQGELAQIMRELKQAQTLAFRKSTREAFRLGIGSGIGELTQAALPFYQDLTPSSIDKLTSKVFTIVDTDALDFMTQYNLTLAGDVHRELSDGIKRTILNGIATGKGADDIVRDLGTVIKDKESFRQTGTKVFNKAQYRMEMIARTEVLRAHNMGRMKFHQRAGVQRLEWMAMDDERMCPVCGAQDGKVYPIEKFPMQPAHPHCRCTNMVASPMTICGGPLQSVAAPTELQGDTCILPPHVLEGMAEAQAAEVAKLQGAFENGSQEELNALTVKQLQTLAKGNGIAIARTKSDFMKLLDAAEPGVDHSELAGTTLQEKLKAYKIGLLRSKEDLAVLLAQKQQQFKQAKLLAEQQSKIPNAGGLSGLSTQQLKDMAKENGISQNITKEDAIELLDKLEPGVNHSGLQGKDLAALKQKHGIGILKNKEQLVEALQKKAGSDLAENTKKKALDEVTQKLIQKQKADVESLVQGVGVPANPKDYKVFLDSVQKAESAIGSAGSLPQDMLAGHAKELALKKQLFAEQVGNLKSSDLKTIAKDTKVQYWQWANKDELTTLFSETDPAKLAAAKKSIEQKHTEWATKHGSKQKEEKPAPIAAQKPVPEPMPAKPPKKASEFSDADQEWHAKGKNAAFKLEGKAVVGGAHEKEFWTDEKGQKWLFKPAAKSADDFVSHGEETAYRIGRLLKADAIEVRSISLNGRTGSIQKWKSDLKEDFDFRSTNPQDLTTVELEQIQKEHVLDWLIANHDGHSKQFIRSQGGQVYGIDKGQAFKFLGKDKLDIDYHPNGALGEEEPYYNKVFRAAKEGKIKPNPQVTFNAIQNVERIADDDYLDLLKPYAEGRFGKDAKGLKQFYEQALERKHGLRKDFEQYYSNVLGQKDFRFEAVPLKLENRKILNAEGEKLVEEARKLGWQGKTLPFDSGDVEDQNALIFSDEFKGKERTVIKMKIRPETNKKLVAALQSQMGPGSAKVGEPLDDDNFYASMLSAVKTANHHASDGKYNQATLDKALQMRDKLAELAKGKDPQAKAMAENYLKWIDELKTAVNEKRTLNGVFEQYTSKQVEAPNKKPEFKVDKSKVTHTKRSLSKGKVIASAEDVDNHGIFGGKSLQSGVQFNASFDDGTKLRYRPRDDANLYAQRGELELVIDGKASGKNVDAMLEKLSKLGIDAQVSSPEHTERMYLEKMAYIRKVDHTSGYKSLQKSLEDRDASLTERVQAMRGYWQKELNVKDITKLPGYDPTGAYQEGFLDRGIKGGYRHQFRFDISDADLEKNMKGYSLVHKLTNSEGMADFIDTVMDNNGAMVSTVEKMRMGVAPGGMSPVADMQSGGASYFFTRIQKDPPSNPSPGLYFKKQMLRRMDAISYGHDAYGKVVDDYVTKNRGASFEQWKDFSEKSSNETIFKYSVTLLDNIEHIVAGSANERNRIIESFTKRGITVLPDGRKVGDVVQTPGTWASR